MNSPLQVQATITVATDDISPSYFIDGRWYSEMGEPLSKTEILEIESHLLNSIVHLNR